MKQPAACRLLQLRQDLIVQEFVKGLGSDAGIGFIIHLNGDAHAVALARAEAAGQRDFGFQLMILDSLLQQLHNLRRALEVAGGADANLDNHDRLHPRQHILAEEFFYGFGGDGEEVFGFEGLGHDTHALLAVAQAEGAAQFNLIAKIVICDKLLQRADNLTGTLDMAGGTDTHGNSHKNTPFDEMDRWK